MSDGAAYCRERLAHAPGDWPLLALFAPAPAQRGLTALGALLADLEAILDGAHAPDLALPRLEWWRAELARSAAGTPVHPITRELGAALSLDPDAAFLLAELVDGALDTLDGPRAADTDAWVLWRQRTGGAPLALALRCAGPDADERETFRLGMALVEIQALADLARRLARQRVCLAPDAPEPGQGTALVAHVAARLRDLRADLAVQRARLRAAPAAVTARVALALGEQRLARLLADPAAALRGPVAAAPPARVFRAWRAAVFPA